MKILSLFFEIDESKSIEYDKIIRKIIGIIALLHILPICFSVLGIAFEQYSIDEIIDAFITGYIIDAFIIVASGLIYLSIRMFDVESVDNDSWVDFSKNKPNEGDCCLIRIFDKNNNSVMLKDVYTWKLGFYSTNNEKCEDNIKYWMILPKSPDEN